MSSNLGLILASITLSSKRGDFFAALGDDPVKGTFL